MNLSRNKNLKIFLTVAILALVVLFVPTKITSALWGFSLYEATIGNLLQAISEIIRTLSAWILSVAAVFFEYILKKTVAEISTGNLGFGPTGIGPAISNVWGTLRDIANLAFIFVLLYAAVKVILDLNTASIGSTIKNIVIVGLLINFSMFFTKVAIDVGNIPAIGFYNAIVAGSTAKPVKVAFGFDQIDPGITSAIMSATDVQSLWGGKGVEAYKNKDSSTQIFINALLTAVLCLVLSVILLVVSVMFIARYILLIALIVFSPLAFIAFILPGLQNRFWEWVNSLKNQVFFPLLFMMMLWVSLRFISALGANGIEWSQSSNPTNITGLLLNYSITIGFLALSLIMSKQMASKSFGFSSVSGALGTGIIGGAGLASRNTLGRWGRSAATDPELLKRAAAGDVGARMKLATANKFAKSSFDVRAVGDTGLGKALGAGNLVSGMGKAAGKGGFSKAVDEKAKKKAEYAKNVFGQTSDEKVELEKIKKENEQKIRDKRKVKLDVAQREEKEADQRRRVYIDENTKEFKEKHDALKREQKVKETQLANEKDPNKKKAIQIELNTIVARATDARESLKDAKQEVEEREEYKNLKEQWENKKEEKSKAKKQKDKKDIDDEEYETEVPGFKDLKNAGKNRQEDYASRIERGPLGIGFIGRLQGNKEATRKIREGLKKDTKKQAKDALKALQDESGEAEPATPTTPTEGAAGGSGGGGTT